MVYAVIYLSGFLLTLVVLARFGKQLGFANYDPPHPEYYDDWDSNAQAYVGFSIMWPMFVGLHLTLWFFNWLVSITQRMIRG